MPIANDTPQRIQSRARRAEAARRRYAENIHSERERCKAAKRATRTTTIGTRRGARYDAQDYAEEFVFLTWQGVPADQIIARSQPRREWFTINVLPLVSRAICGTCGDVFEPQTVGSLTRCSKTCGIGKVSDD